MARIPIYTPAPVTLTQCFPIMNIDPTTGINSGMSWNQTADFYVDKHKILSVGSYYDADAKEFSPVRIVVIEGILSPIYVTDSYNTIKAYIDSKDCNDLCNSV